MIQVDEAFRVAAPPQAVFDALSDVERVVECLPGARIVGAVDGRNVLIQARVAFGKLSISYRGSLHVTGDDLIARRISYRVRGREVRGEGVIEAIVDVSLEEAGGRTVATVKADASISGRAAILRTDVVNEAARTMLTRFGEALSVEMGAVPMPAVTTANTAPGRRDIELLGKVGGVDENDEAPVTMGSAAATETDDPAIAGEVRLMTDQPVFLDGDPGPDTLLLRLMRHLDSRPWLAPAGLLTLFTVVLLLRRRSRR